MKFSSRVDIRLLQWTTILMVGMLLLCVCLMFLDQRQITGVNAWLKPAKFALSISLFTATLSTMLHLIPMTIWTRVAGIGSSLTLLGEMVLISMQAARGTTSHFNHETPFDAAVFSVMGILIVSNTLLVLVILIEFLRARHIDPALVWGIRFGLLFTIMASLEGFMIVANNGHSVGLHDGGPGLPIVNWSSQGGDLRVAHFLGMHAMQVLPLIGLVLSKRRVSWPALAMTLAFLLYLSVFAYTLREALHGRPLIPA